MSDKEDEMHEIEWGEVGKNRKEKSASSMFSMRDYSAHVLPLVSEKRSKY